MNKNPVISIVIPNYNRSNLVLGLLKSIYKQNFKSFEVIVVDDNSNDDSVKLINKKFPKVKIIELKENKGPAIARNEGIKKAKGDIIINLDNDEEFIGTKNLSYIIEKFEKNKNIHVLAFRIIKESTKKDDWRCWWHPRSKNFSNKEFFTTYFGAGISAFRKEVFEKAGLYPEDLKFVCEEEDLGYRILDKGFNIFYFPKVRLLHKSDHKRDDRYYYYKRRNQLWMVIKYFPAFKGFLFLFPRIILSFFNSVFDGYLLLYIKGLYSGIKGTRKSFNYRRPLSKNTWKKIDLIKKGTFL